MQAGKRATTSRSPHRGALLVFMVGILLLTALTVWHEGERAGRGAVDGLPYLARVNAGQPAPPFQAVTLAGRQISFPEDYPGKLVLVDFWATWCGPCLAELPHLREAYREFHGRGLEIIGVSLDADQRVPAETVRRFLKNNDAPWEVVYDGASEIAGAYRVMGIPAAFLVDGDTGVVLARGNQLRGHTLRATVDTALRQKLSD